MQDISVRIRICAGYISECSVMPVQGISVKVRLCAVHISEGSVICGTYQ